MLNYRRVLIDISGPSHWHISIQLLTISLIVSENLGYIQADHIGNGWKWDMIYYCNQQNLGQSPSLHNPYVLGWNMVKKIHVSW